MAKKTYLKNTIGEVTARVTKILGLVKPLRSDYYNIDIHNSNMDKIEEKFNEIEMNSVDRNHTHTKSNITDFEHTHTKNSITDFSHTHKKSEISDFSHTHTKNNITDFAHRHNKSEIDNFDHTHTIEDIEGLELSSTNVNRPNGKTVEQSISDNETSISSLDKKTDTTNTNVTNLTTVVNSVQKHKVTTDIGEPLGYTNQDLNNLRKIGFYCGENMQNAPVVGAGQWFSIDSRVTNNYGHQVATDWFSGKQYIRIITNNVWQPWRSL